MKRRESITLPASNPSDGKEGIRLQAPLATVCSVPSTIAVEPDVRISRIRLSDWLHREAHERNQI
jgi:hypothetical protein